MSHLFGRKGWNITNIFAKGLHQEVGDSNEKCLAMPSISQLTVSSLCLTIPIYFGSCEFWWSRDAQAICTPVFPDADHTVQFRPSALDHRLIA